MVPYNVAFKNKTSEDVFLLVVDSIVDVIFFIDIGKYSLLNFTIISTVFLVLLDLILFISLKPKPHEELWH